MNEDLYHDLLMRIASLELRVAALEPTKPDILPIESYSVTVTEEFPDETLTKDSI
jgi:hypothetical protein